MGLWSDIEDRVLGNDPSAPNLFSKAQILEDEQKKKDAAAAAAAAAANAPPPAPPPPAPVAAPPPPPPAPVAAAFDPTPYRNQVDSSFGMFTPEFYANKYAAAYDPYKSGVESQYGVAKDALTAGLAKRGLADSSQGRGLFQQLDALRDQSFNQGQSAAQGFQTSLSDAVNKSKQDLYGGIGEGQDNASIGGKAQSEAARLSGTAPPASSLGDVFSSLVSPYAATRSPGGPVNPELKAFSTGSNLNLANVGGGPAASTKVVSAPPKKKF